MHEQGHRNLKRPARAFPQGGYSLAEVLATVVVLGILVSIAVIIFLGILEQRRVDAATDELVSDLRLAHTRATSELTDWRVVIVLDRGDEADGPDYYVMRLDAPYDGEGPGPEVAGITPESFEGNVLGKNVITPSGSRVDDHEAKYWASPWGPATPEGVRTRTLEFNADGTMTFFRSPSGSICVTADGRPQNRVVSLSATSRLRVESGSSCDTSGGG